MRFEDLPDLLTVEEAAAFLRISRGLAYQLANVFVDTGGEAGLPVIQLGRRRYMVPKCQLWKVLTGELTLRPREPRPAPPTAPRTARARRAATQLTLIDQPPAV